MTPPKPDPWAHVTLPTTEHPWAPITCTEFRQELAALRRAEDVTVKQDHDLFLYSSGGRVRLATFTVAGRCHHQRCGKSVVAWVRDEYRVKAGEG